MALTLEFFNHFNQFIQEYQKNGGGAYLTWTSADTNYKELLPLLHSIQTTVYLKQANLTACNVIQYLSLHALQISKANPLFANHVLKFLIKYDSTSNEIGLLLNDSMPKIVSTPDEYSEEFFCHFASFIKEYRQSKSDPKVKELVSVLEFIQQRAIETLEENKPSYLFNDMNILHFLAPHVLMLQAENKEFCNCFNQFVARYDEKTNRLGRFLSGPMPELRTNLERVEMSSDKDDVLNLSKLELCEKLMQVTQKVCDQAELEHKTSRAELKTKQSIIDDLRAKLAQQKEISKKAQDELRAQAYKQQHSKTKKTSPAAPPSPPPPPPIAKIHSLKIKVKTFDVLKKADNKAVDGKENKQNSMIDELSTVLAARQSKPFVDPRSKHVTTRQNKLELILSQRLSSMRKFIDDSGDRDEGDESDSTPASLKI